MDYSAMIDKKISKINEDKQLAEKKEYSDLVTAKKRFIQTAPEVKKLFNPCGDSGEDGKTGRYRAFCRDLSSRFADRDFRGSVRPDIHYQSFRHLSRQQSVRADDGKGREDRRHVERACPARSPSFHGALRNHQECCGKIRLFPPDGTESSRYIGQRDTPRRGEDGNARRVNGGARRFL